MAESEVSGGQAAADTAGTTAAAPEGQTAGQSVAPDQTTVNGSGQSGESFFDYESIKGKPELEAAYKQMQASYTKGRQEFAAGKDKISQYDQFMSNPVDTMRQLAQQYGYQMVQGEVKSEDGTEKTYSNWKEVRDDIREEVRTELMQELQPMFGEMQNIKKQSVEQALDNAHPDWRTYEDEMMASLKEHPTLVSNPDLLYRMSVPPAVLEARANKAALAKIQGTTEGGQVQGQSTTTQQAATSPVKRSFDEAVKFAQQEMKRQGLAPPRE